MQARYTRRRCNWIGLVPSIGGGLLSIRCFLVAEAVMAQTVGYRGRKLGEVRVAVELGQTGDVSRRGR